MRRSPWVCLALLPACDLVFKLEPVGTVGPFERCGDLTTESWRYDLIERGAITLTKAMAENSCKTRGMLPSAINTQAELDFLAQNFARADPNPPPIPDPNTAWTGLTREGADWVDPEGCPTFTRFRSGEGNDGAASTCAQLVTDGLLDAHCGMTTNAVICEHVRPPIAGCDAPFNASRYRAIVGSFSHGDAVALCDQPNEHLVEIESDTEQLAVDDFAANHMIGRYWLDADFDLVAFRWSASTGCPPWFDWAAGEPTLAADANVALREIGIGTRNVAGDLTNVICETNK